MEFLEPHLFLFQFNASITVTFQFLFKMNETTLNDIMESNSIYFKLCAGFCYREEDMQRIRC